MLRYIFLPLLFSLIVCGCGGRPTTGCGGISYGVSNESYAGTYTGSYSKGAFQGAAENLTLNFSISAASKITGTVTEPSSQKTTTISGEIGDWFDGCASDYTFLEIRFTFPGETDARTLFANRALGQTQPWPFTVSYVQGPTQIGDGTLELVKQ